MSKEKKPFKDTKFASFLNKAGSVIKDNGGDILDIAGKVATGNISGAIGETIDLLGKGDNPAAASLLNELMIQKAEIEKELFALELEDRQSARNLQVAALAQDSWLAKHFIYILASFIVLSATGIGIAMFFVEFPEHNRRLIEMFADIYLFAGALMVLQFFFGSSKGSSDKNSIIKSK